MLRWLTRQAYRLRSIDFWMALAASAIAVLMIVAASEAQAQTYRPTPVLKATNAGGVCVLIVRLRL